MVAHKVDLQVRGRRLPGSNGHLGRILAGIHRHRDAMAEITLQTDGCAIGTHMPAIVTAEAPGRILVATVVEKRLPGDARLLKYQPEHQLSGQLDGPFNLSRVADGDPRVGGTVALLKRICGGQCLCLVAVFCVQQGQQFRLGKGKICTQATFGHRLVHQFLGRWKGMAYAVVAVHTVHDPFFGAGDLLGG